MIGSKLLTFEFQGSASQKKVFFSAKFLVMASKRPLILETGELRWGVVPPCWCSGKFVGTVELNWIEMLSNVSLQPKFNASC